MVTSDDQPEGLTTAAEGNAQTTRDGDLFVGWGVLPYSSEFSRTAFCVGHLEARRRARAPHPPAITAIQAAAARLLASVRSWPIGSLADSSMSLPG